MTTKKENTAERLRREAREHEIAQRKAMMIPFSPFARYCLDLKGKDLYYKGKKIYKYIAWHLGYKSAEKILLGLTEISTKDKVKSEVE